jgi:DNA-binding LytR/AlgR family response regulator
MDRPDRGDATEDRGDADGGSTTGRGPVRIVARRKRNLVFLDRSEVWAYEAADRLTFVHSSQGKFDVDLSLAAIEASSGSLTRVHRNWLVNLDRVRELVREEGELALRVGQDLGTAHVRVPVSRDRARAVRELLLRSATGVRDPIGGRETPRRNARRAR